jgi:hypothetical protein
MFHLIIFFAIDLDGTIQVFMAFLVPRVLCKALRVFVVRKALHRREIG